MMRSLYSGISGLRNHQTRMDVIGNNIANVNTAGYKTSRVIFQDIFSQNLASGMSNQGNIGGTNPLQIGLGIKLSSVDVIHTRAAFGRTDKETDMMINGDGFFIVAEMNPDTGAFEPYYTRAGNFVIDEQGYLVTTHGYYVLGYTAGGEQAEPLMMGVVDPGQAFVQEVPRVTIPGGWRTVQDLTTLTPPGTGNGIRIPAGSLGQINLYNGDNQAYPLTDVDIASGATLAAGALFPGSLAVAEPVPATGTWPTGTVNLRNRVPGEQARDPVFGLVPSGEIPDTGFGNLSRIRVISELFQSIKWEELTAAEQATLQANINNLRTIMNADPIDYVAYQAAQNALNTQILALQLNFPQEEVSLPGFGVANNGDVSVILNNREVVIGRIAVAMFANPEGLTKGGNSLYRESAASGPAVVTQALNEGAGSIDGGGLEMSNVDLASEFTDMIVTQRGFQANSRIITVSDTMLEELVNLKR